MVKDLALGKYSSSDWNEERWNREWSARGSGGGIVNFRVEENVALFEQDWARQGLLWVGSVGRWTVYAGIKKRERESRLLLDWRGNYRQKRRRRRR